MPGVGRLARRGRPQLHMFTQDIPNAGFRSPAGRWLHAALFESADKLARRSSRVTDGHDDSGTAGVPHIPVLLNSVLRWLSPRDGGVYLDATFGAGGYTRAILQAAETRVIAVDRDPTAIAAGAGLVAQSGGRLALI